MGELLFTLQDLAADVLDALATGDNDLARTRAHLIIGTIEAVVSHG